MNRFVAALSAAAVVASTGVAVAGGHYDANPVGSRRRKKPDVKPSGVAAGAVDRLRTGARAPTAAPTLSARPTREVAHFLIYPDQTLGEP